MPPVGPLVAALSLPLVQSGSRPCCRPEPSRMDPHNPPPPRARRRHQYTRHPRAANQHRTRRRSPTLANKKGCGRRKRGKEGIYKHTTRSRGFMARGPRHGGCLRAQSSTRQSNAPSMQSGTCVEPGWVRSLVEGRPAPVPSSPKNYSPREARSLLSRSRGPTPARNVGDGRASRGGRDDAEAPWTTTLRTRKRPGVIHLCVPPLMRSAPSVAMCPASTFAGRDAEPPLLPPPSSPASSSPSSVSPLSRLPPLGKVYCNGPGVGNARRN